jgi:hypothetical protein
VCRCLTTQVIDEEAEYKMINYKLSEQCDRHRNALQAINEKIACFDDMKKELTQTKERYQESERARVALH